MEDFIGFERATIYSNGVTIKPMKNRSVTVWQNKVFGDMCIEMRRADVSAEDKEKPTVESKLIRDKIQMTGFRISKESAFALMCALHKYFQDIDPMMPTTFTYEEK